MIKHKVPGGLILEGHVLDALASLPEGSVSCVVTSPPYWSLRKYDAPNVIWDGDESCEHEWGKSIIMRSPSGSLNGSTLGGEPPGQHNRPRSSFCSRCGAWLGQFGREPTPEMYVEHTIDVLRAIRRVLRDDGVVFWNVGDGYSGSWGNFGTREGKQRSVNTHRDPRKAWDNNTERPATSYSHPTLKPKDLILMPERVALAAQQDGWYIRKRIIWHKPNIKPESVQDRPTLDYEHIWMMTKKPHYWWDRTAVLEPAIHAGRIVKATGNGAKNADEGHSRTTKGFTLHDTLVTARRNLRSVWSFPTAQYKDAHYAVFPMELPRRCILASCPPEICVRCDTPRVRIVKKQTHFEGGSGRAGTQPEEIKGKWQEDRHGKNLLLGPVVDHQTVGWSDCGCEEPDYGPGIVLDPFFGTGTTGLAARELGRLFIGVELSPTYVEMVKRRLSAPVKVS